MIKVSKKNYRERLGALLLLLLIGTMTLTLPAVASGNPLQKASLIPMWSPQAQFAGYYVALAKGIYAKHGIDLTILKGGPGHSPSQALQRGEADFAVLWLTTALQQYATGEKVINVAQIVQRSSMILIAKKNSGISTPADMQGKKVGLWGGDFAIPAQAFLDKYHLQVRKIPQAYTVNLFLRGGIDVASAMWFNEYHTILNSGLNPEELNIFFLNDYTINFPEDGLYTLATTFRKKRDLAETFAKASLEGWQYTFDHPNEALDIVIRSMKEAKLPANMAHQKWMLNRMRDLILPRQNKAKMGQLKLSNYEKVGEELHRTGVIKAIPEFNEFIGKTDAHQ